MSKIDNPFGTALEAFGDYMGSTFRVCIPARITKYDKKHHTADVQPLIKDNSGDNPGIIQDVLVAKSVYMIDEIWDKMDDYISGDKIKITPPKKLIKVGTEVTVVFCDYSIDHYKPGDGKIVSRGSDDRQHNVNDGIIVALM